MCGKKTGKNLEAQKKNKIILMCNWNDRDYNVGHIAQQEICHQTQKPLINTFSSYLQFPFPLIFRGIG
jgi:hypothetical protein